MKGENGLQALFASISHVLADSHTCYSAYKTLDPNESVVRMEPTRNQEFSGQLDKLMGNEANQILSSKNILTSIKAKSGIKPTLPMNVIDLEAIEMEKAKAQQYTNGEGFVSTNDIITSWFFRSWNDMRQLEKPYARMD